MRRFSGVGALVLLVVLALGVGHAIEMLFWLVPFGIVPTAIVASSLLAQRSLASHVLAVAQALETGGVEEGRKAVSMIVGRDPERLDEAGVSRAAIESLAENFSDGIVAPAFWLAAGRARRGRRLQGGEHGRLDDRPSHAAPRGFRLGGGALRRSDQPSRLAPLGAAGHRRGAADAFRQRGECLASVRRDAHLHRSPNAGWPEAAFAGALGLALAGPRSYGGVAVKDATMGEGGRREASAADIRAALRLFWIADLLLVGLIGILAGAIWLLA